MESGKMFREMAKSDLRIKEMLDNGVLVPDQETIDYIERFLVEKNAGFENLIFDGYPRSVNQYNLLRHWLSTKGSKIDFVINLNLPREKSMERLTARRTCVDCGEVYNLLTKPPKGNLCDRCGGALIQRDDDKPEVIEKRLKTYEESTLPIVELAQGEGLLIKADADRPIEDIFQDIVEQLENAKNKRH